MVGVIGGGLAVDPATGAITGTPAFAIGGGGSKATVTEAFAAVGDELDNLNSAVNGVLDDALLFDDTAYTATRAGIATRITGVANGHIAAGRSDAVKGAKPNTTNQNITQNDAPTHTPTGHVTTKK